MLRDFFDAGDITKIRAIGMPGGNEFLIRDVMTLHARHAALVHVLQFDHAELQAFDITRTLQPEFGIAFGMRIFITAARPVTTFATHTVFNFAAFFAGENRAMTRHALLIAFEHRVRADARELGDFFISRRVVIKRIDRDFVRVIFPPGILFRVAIVLRQPTTARPEGLMLRVRARSQCANNEDDAKLQSMFKKFGKPTIPPSRGVLRNPQQTA